MKLDYTIEDPLKRKELVEKILNQTPPENLNPKFLEILSDYIIFAMDKKEKQEKKILTENRLVTVNKRETSFEGLTSRLENGEDGIYNMLSGNDKNIILTPKISITQKDIDEIPGMKQLRDSIEQVAEQEKWAKGKKKYLLRKQLIELRQDQYVLKNAYQKPIYMMNITKTPHIISLEENITIDKNGNVQSDGRINLFDPKHISIILRNYQALKEWTKGKFSNDTWYLIEDLDNLINQTLKTAFPLYYDLLRYKIKGMSNQEIQNYLFQKYNIKYTTQYISSLWCNKIPKLLAEKAQENYLIWYYTNVEKGTWKKCSRCGQIKLAHNRFFSKNKTSKDGFYSICKECRNKKKGDK